MRYIDSSVFISAFLPTDPNHNVCRRLVDSIIHDRLATVISVFETFMDSVLAVSVSTGLPGADAIHFVSAISLPEVEEIMTLDRHFKRVKDQIKVTMLNE